MKLIDRGEGTPVVVIPGIQGRWEWMGPAIDALAQRCRVITFSLADEPSCGGSFDERRGFGCYMDQVIEALDAAGVRKAAICGVSYGGLVAASFAARYPDRTSALVLVSALPPSWRPDARVAFYLRAPRLLTPLFLLASLRMYREIAAANRGVVQGAAAALRRAWCAVTHMFSPSRMARRVQMLLSAGLEQELRSATMPTVPPSLASMLPTLIIVGDPDLDRVVPVARTQEYLQLWPQARLATIARTGHLGSITRPEEFARLVVPFAERAADETETRRRVG